MVGGGVLLVVEWELSTKPGREFFVATTLSILRVLTLFFVQEMYNSVVDVIETPRDA